ncbi:FecR domain-containing protein [Chitinophaga vietnamensis]|uniref:FecR domain-containing protein n=1 Tax=Chitinophaga vietnamensis TaxID=2593957 RepID=UPI00117822F7|nr:FecR domain-containing protein [Chitinophaga vietnamensis]
MNDSYDIHQLITEKLEGLITSEQERWLDALIAQDPVVRAMWEKQRHDWEEKAARLAAKPDLEDITTMFSQGEAARIRRFPTRWVAAAAAITGISLGAWWFLSMRQHSPALAAVNSHEISLQLANGQEVNLSRNTGDVSAEQLLLHNHNNTLTFDSKDKQAGINTLRVPAGIDYKLQLPDGSEIWLNAATTVQFPSTFNGNTREVTVNGEAYMKIATDAARPFLVHTAGTTVKVLGTAFNINSYDSAALRVSLVEGAVSVATAKQSIKLSPGMQAICNHQGAIRQRPFDAARELSWQQGLQYFENASLGEICQQIPHWYNIHVVIDNPAIAQEAFTGRLDRKKPLNTFLDDLKATTTINYYYSADSVLHFK